MTIPLERNATYSCRPFVALAWYFLYSNSASAGRPCEQRHFGRAAINRGRQLVSVHESVNQVADSVKGEIARTLFYMHVEYELPLNGMLPMLKRWNTADPPKQYERWRNKAIEVLQGIRNRFIDDPTLIAEIR